MGNTFTMYEEIEIEACQKQVRLRNILMRQIEETGKNGSMLRILSPMVCLTKKKSYLLELSHFKHKKKHTPDFINVLGKKNKKHLNRKKTFEE